LASYCSENGEIKRQDFSLGSEILTTQTHIDFGSLGIGIGIRRLLDLVCFFLGHPGTLFSHLQMVTSWPSGLRFHRASQKGLIVCLCFRCLQLGFLTLHYFDIDINYLKDTGESFVCGSSTLPRQRSINSWVGVGRLILPLSL